MYVCLFLDLALARWPVRNIETHVSYKNFFCAICNGVNVTKSLETLSNVTAELRNNTDQQPDRISILEWWPARVFCPEQEIEQYLHNQPGHEKLIQLVDK